MNGQYLSAATAETLFPIVAPQLTELGVTADRDATLRAIAAVKTRSRTTIEVARQVAVRLDAKRVVLDDKAAKEIAKDEAGYKSTLQASIERLRDSDWSAEALEKTLRALSDERGVAAGKIFQPIRIALTGGTVSEPVNELLVVVGKDAALRRLELAAKA
jgi:glutamyl-tRNA synthetase